MLWRMEDTGLAVKTPPRYCVLLARTNNIGLWEGKQAPEDTVKGIREVASRLLKKFPGTHLILMEVTPYGPGIPAVRCGSARRRLMNSCVSSGFQEPPFCPLTGIC